MMVILTGVCWCFIKAFICMILISDGRHLFMCLLAICMSYLEKPLFRYSGRLLHFMTVWKCAEKEHSSMIYDIVLHCGSLHIILFTNFSPCTSWQVHSITLFLIRNIRNIMANFRYFRSMTCLLLHCYLKRHACLVSHVRLFATPWTIAHQAPLSMEFSRQEYCGGFSSVQSFSHVWLFATPRTAVRQV